MNEEKGKIIKITFEYENVKQSLSGSQAEDWLDKVQGMCFSLEIRNQNPFKNTNFVWDEEDLK